MTHVPNPIFLRLAMKRTWATATAAVAMISVGGCPSMTGPADVSSLDRTVWVLSSLPGRVLVSGRPATANFEGGRVQGGDGCNFYRADSTVKGSSIEIGPPERTLMGCAPDVMEQAEAFMAALNGARSYRVSGTQLQLLGADGAVLSTLTAQSLAGTRWRTTMMISDGKGGRVSSAAGSIVTVAFAADGKASGSAGCNSYTSTYQADGSRLRFTRAAATRRMCADAAVMEQEQAFFEALESVATMWMMQADFLQLRTAEGALVLNLVRDRRP